VLRFTQGLGHSTNLSYRFPWGIWIGFDVLCGVVLAAGGFTLTAAVHILNIERLRPIVRPAILTAFLGYVLVCVALMFDLGRPYRIWHPLTMRNPHSVMFEVAYCVMLYTAVLSFEFAPIVMERLNLRTPLRVIHAMLIPLVILGVILSTLHQSSLGTLYLIVPEKLHPFWYSPLLPVLFFISAIAVGLAMTIFESSMSARVFGRQLELPILQELGRILLVVLWVYAIVRIDDLLRRGVLKLSLEPGYEMYLFWTEIILGLAAPLILMSHPGIRQSPGGLYLAAVLVVLGFITNRLNVSITGLEWSAGAH
jgi:Ni/Fe-hydrogenase subunit HybB-like protein